MFFVYGLQVTTPISWFIVFLCLMQITDVVIAMPVRPFYLFIFLSLVWTSTVFIWLDILLSVSFVILLFFLFCFVLDLPWTF
jgi:hypothetical protein